MWGPTYQAVMAIMVTSTKKETSRGIGSGGKFPGPNGKKPGGNGWNGGDHSKPKFSPATYRITMWILLASIVMMFAALSSVYIMLSEQRPVVMPRMFLVSTGLILCSSFTFQRAKRSLQRNQAGAHTRWLLLTLALGLSFLISQLLGWQELARAGVYFAGHPKSSFFYLATALHGAHLIGGIGLVLYLVIKSLRLLPLANDEKHSTWTGVVGLYWHLIDIIWVFLFPLFYLVE